MQKHQYILPILILLYAWWPGFPGSPDAYAQQGPVISNIQWSPAVPTQGQVITVTANVTADTSLSVVTIVDLNVGNNISMTLAGGSSYEGLIPAQDAGTQVNFRIRAVDSAGAATTSDQQSFTVGLAAPGNLAADLDEDAAVVTLTWSPVAGASSYKVYRTLEPPADLLLTSGVTETMFVDDRIGSARELYYRVKAVRGGTESGFSNEASVNMVFNTAPFTPSGSRYETLIIAQQSDVILTPELELDLNLLFADDDGDPLSYSFLTPPAGSLVQSAEISADDVLRVAFTGLLGNVQFSILADDGRFGQAVVTFSVTVDAPPRLQSPTIETEPVRDEPVEISVVVEDNNLDRVEINFRRGGDGSLFSDQMTPAGDNRFTYTIPAFAVGERGLEYYIIAWDSQELSATQPALSPPMQTELVPFSLGVHIPGEGVKKETAQPTISSTPNAYRLVSLPLELDDASLKGVFEDDLGSYKDSEWRLFQPLQNTLPSALPEYPNAGSVAPGRAFWLVVREENNFLDSGSGQTVSTAAPFSIDLEPGWNYFGNPFAFTIPVEMMRMSSGNPLDIRYFDGSGWSRFDASSSLHPFEGYAISNNATAADQLLIYPNEDLLSNASPQKHIAQQNTAAGYIDIIAHAGELRDANRILLDASSKTGWDEGDLPEPPTIGQFVSVAFPHEDWLQPLKRYSTDARPMPASGDSWLFEVTSSVAAPVVLSFSGIDALPDHLEAWLVDTQLGTSQPLDDQTTYRVNSTMHAPQQLELVVGTRAFLEKQQTLLADSVEDFHLAPTYPNPFSSTTTIPFQVPEDVHVTLEVYNLLGKRVATLLQDRSTRAGRHHVVWDGKSDAGAPVANGVYVLKIDAGEFTGSRQVLVLR